MVNNTPLAKRRQKLLGATGSVSGAASILGSWQVCHNLCLGLIALLSAIGITVTGMPLLFFTKIAIPLWFGAVFLLMIVLYFYTKKQCISKNLLLVNAGLIIAGTPFPAIQKYQLWFWLAGGIFVTAALVFYLNTKINRRNGGCKHA